jgi:hypothetical protein
MVSLSKVETLWVPWTRPLDRRPRSAALRGSLSFVWLKGCGASEALHAVSAEALRQTGDTTGAFETHDKVLTGGPSRGP